MKIIRRLFTGGLVLSALAASALADQIVSYTSTLNAIKTDVTDDPINMTPFQAGVGGVPADAVLESFTVSFTEHIVGNISISNTGTSSSTITGTIDSLGLLYLFTSTPAKDLPINAANPPTDDAFGGGGPDPSFKATAVLAPNGSAGPFSYDKSQSAVTGSISDGTSLSDVEAAWKVYIDSATNVLTGATGSGNGQATYNNSISGSVTVTYDYVEVSGTPEPATMILFGSALVGLGLIRKRVRNS